MLDTSQLLSFSQYSHLSSTAEYRPSTGTRVLDTRILPARCSRLLLLLLRSYSAPTPLLLLPLMSSGGGPTPCHCSALSVLQPTDQLPWSQESGLGLAGGLDTDMCLGPAVLLLLLLPSPVLLLLLLLPLLLLPLLLPPCSIFDKEHCMQ